MSEEKFVITGSAKKKVITTLIVGVVLFVIGIIGVSTKAFTPEGGGHHASVAVQNNLVADHHEGHGEHAAETHTDAHASEGHGHAEAHASEGHGDAHASEGHGDAHGDHHGHAYSWTKRLFSNLWINNVFFTGLAIVCVFFLALQYLTWSGWSALLSRVMIAFGQYLPIAGILMLITYFVAGHDLFHWLDSDLFDPNSPKYDKIIAGKEMYLNPIFFIARMIGYFTLWTLLFILIRKQMKLEDENGGTLHHYKIVDFSGAFIVIFGISSSMCAWDWIMSIDTHWFSTMFGWYVFASWFVSGLSAITLATIYLKKAGYLKDVNENHLHDMGKFMFAFSIFWTYIWFSQFILIWYANIPEESIYFIERFFNNDNVYTPIVIMNLVINFLFPFLFLMTRDAKRQMTLLQVAAFGILIGHWFDFYLMIMPGTIGKHGGFDLGIFTLEAGLILIYASIFIGAVMYGLTKLNLVAENHPYLEESKHHHT
ncbi:MAG: quinol:cytochrome C oxidoreductase [Cytophagales bacterium]|nr:quinol:cytochrome C oxidoreductase [Cytophagales bacterium]